MKKSGILLALLALLVVPAWALNLSPSATVSLITCAPGKDFYEVFGHTAIRVHDPERIVAPNRDMDVVFNYGVFNFDRPDFYSNFAKGHLVYMLGAWSFGGFVNDYVYENRTVTEQVLNLTDAQKQALFDYLDNNNLPQNRDYVYDYFFNNCSTKPRDIIEQITGHHIKYDFAYAKGTHYSIRDLVNTCTPRDNWGDLGIDIALGSEIDKPVDPYKYTYLPEYLMKAFALAKIEENGTSRDLVKETKILYQSHPEPPAPADWTSPLHVFWIFFAVVALITGVNFYRGKRGYWLDALLFTIVGATGFVLFYISFFTNHHAKGNMNLLWAFPLGFPMGILLLFPTLRPKVSWYFAAAGLVMLLLLALWLWLPQDLNYTLIPVIAALLLRCANVFYFERIKR